MAPKKRKASTTTGTPAKKVRIGATSEIPDTPVSTASGRPRRTSVGNPNYDDTKRHSSTTQNRANTGPKPKAEPVVKPQPGKGTTSGGVMTAQRPDMVQYTYTPRKRGPAKSATASTKAASTKATTTKAATTKAATTKAAATKAAATKAGKRGRKPKLSANTINDDIASSALDSQDSINTVPKNNVTVTINGDASRTDDTETVDHDIQYWLMKAEPESRMEKGRDVKFSIDDLMAKTEPEGWDGVRNAVARNNMRAMRKGDLAFFYHSNCANPGVAGVMRIVAEHSVDESAFDPEHPYFDPKSDRGKPKWDLVHVEHVKKFDTFIPLKELRTFALSGGALANMQMLKQSRLSVSAVAASEWRFILELAGENASLGHGDGKEGYESDVDGEGDETAGVSDGDALGVLNDETVGLGITVEGVGNGEA